MISYNRYKAMSDALNATGRPIFYSICNWGTDYPWNWAPTISNSWRIAGDIYDSFDRPDTRCPCTTWDCKLPGFHCSVMNILNKVAAFTDKGRVGGWNDLDALEVGNSGMTDDEYKLHMTMWYVAAGPHSTPLLQPSSIPGTVLIADLCRALFKSPLILGTDITLLSPSTLSIIANPAILAISQDPAGNAAFRVWEKSPPLVQNNTYSTDLYTAGSTYFFTGQLTGGTLPSPLSPIEPMILDLPKTPPPFYLTPQLIPQPRRLRHCIPQRRPNHPTHVRDHERHLRRPSDHRLLRPRAAPLRIVGRARPLGEPNARHRRFRHPEWHLQ